MKLKVLGSSSAGNCYLLENNQEALIIDCGVRMDSIKKAVAFNVAKVVACLITHEHHDHCKAVEDVIKAGINVYATKGTFEAMLPDGGSHRARIIAPGKEFKVGGFTILPFDVKHDAADPVNFLVHHEETGNILYVTDTFYVPYTFRNLNHLLVEANYSQEIIDRKLKEGSTPGFLRDRIFKSHMNLETCKDLLQANDLTKVQNIVLIHLSDSNSDEVRFKKEVQQLTGKQVYVATPGLTVELSKQPF